MKLTDHYPELRQLKLLWDALTDPTRDQPIRRPLNIVELAPESPAEFAARVIRH